MGKTEESCRCADRAQPGTDGYSPGSGRESDDDRLCRG